jgi:hypothetical protein
MFIAIMNNYNNKIWIQHPLARGLWAIEHPPGKCFGILGLCGEVFRHPKPFVDQILLAIPPSVLIGCHPTPNYFSKIVPTPGVEPGRDL